MEITDILTMFSLTRQEAMIYLLLLSEGTLTGYEVSKQSGISRSNSYTSLASLVEKGAANIIEDTATRYTAIEIGEFCKNKIAELNRMRITLEKKVPQHRAQEDGYITIKGSKHVFDKIINLVSSACERIYISVDRVAFLQVSPYLEEAIQRNLKVVVITDSEMAVDGATVYRTKRTENQIRLIVDSTAILTGETNDDGSCLFSKKKNLVDLFKETLKNEIRLIELGQI